MARIIPRTIIIRPFSGKIDERKLIAKLEKMYPGTRINIKKVKGR